MTSEACPSMLVLDRSFVGERTEPALQAHVASCPRCRAEIADRERVAAAFAPVATAPGFGRLVETLDRAGRARRRRLAVAGGALAAAAAVTLVIALPRDAADRASSAQPETTTRRKGSLGLNVIVKRADGRIEHLVSGDRVSPGDAIRFALTSDTAGSVAVLGIDAAGVISPYTEARLEPGRDQVLDGSIVLDATLGTERLVAILCKDGIDMRELADRARAALQRAGNAPARIDTLELAATCEQSAFLLEKVRE